MSRLRSAAAVLVGAVLLAALPALPAGASELESSRPPTPQATEKEQRRTVTPTPNPSGPSRTVPAQTCNVYASSSGFGLLCSTAGAGLTLAAQAEAAGIDLGRPFCWDDPDLPDGFDPASQGPPPPGPGQWWLHTCLTFEGAVVKDNARVTYEYLFHQDGDEDELNDAEAAFVTRVLGRGQIPYLQVQTSPVASPRVGQDVAFSMLCSPKVQCDERADGWHIETPRIDVGGVVMHAELVHLRVLPEGESGPAVDCAFAGRPVTAEELDAADEDDPTICRHTYERSSNARGGGTSRDRYPAKVTAYWQVFVDDGSGPEPFQLAYEKSSTNLIRVTEVQTLVVS